MKITSLIPVLLLTLGAGMIAGAKLHANQVAAEKAKKQEIIIQEVVKDIPASIEKSNQIEAKIDQSNASITKIKRAVRDRIQHQEKSYEVNLSMPQTSVGYCAPFTLDVGTVWLLNAAREGRDLDTSSFSDEALAASSNIGISKLLENDLEVVRLYKDLAKRHDELVDAVEKKLKQQAK